MLFCVSWVTFLHWWADLKQKAEPLPLAISLPRGRGPRGDSKRAWNSVTTEGASSQTPPYQLRAPRDRQCLRKTCGTEHSKSQQPPVCPLPKLGPNAKQSRPFVALWGGSMKFPGCVASCRAACHLLGQQISCFFSFHGLNRLFLPGADLWTQCGCGEFSPGCWSLPYVPQEPAVPCLSLPRAQGWLKVS